MGVFCCESGAWEWESPMGMWEQPGRRALGRVLSQKNLHHHHHPSPLCLLPALPGLCHRTCAGTRCCLAPELWNKLPQEGWDPHSQGTQSAWVQIQHKWRLKLMPAQRECAAFCWLSQLVSQFPRMPAVCRRGWSSQAIRSKKTLSASLLFSSIYNYCVRELHNL